MTGASALECGFQGAEHSEGIGLLSPQVEKRPEHNHTVTLVLCFERRPSVRVQS